MKPGSSIFTTAHLRYLRAVRGTMLRSLSGESLATALDGFEAGNLRAAAQLWQSMSERDDVLSSVKPKREKSVARRDWQVLTSDDSAEAKRQAKILTEFWNNVKCVDAFDQNRRGGFAELVRQMMRAVSFRYQAHHLVWHPSSDMLRCTFEGVPLTFFENRTGKLRFCQTGMEMDGTEMPPEEWLVTCGDGLMVAGSIGYFCKRNALSDWMAFSDKFGMPGILARTSQGKDTPGGIAMAEAAESFGQDWAAVLYGDDGSGKIDLIEAKGGSSTLPFPNLIERVDRRLASLYRGADLSSMSSSQGEGTGASLQSGETDLIEQDDALSISERLNEIEEIVLRWWFGPRVKVKAYIRLIVPQSEDLKLLITAVESLVSLGAPVAVADVLERFGFQIPPKGEPLLGEDPEQEEEEDDEMTEINAGMNEDRFLADAGRLLSNASREDRENLVGELKAVLAAPEGAQLNALATFVKRLPENIGQDAAQVRAWEALLASALVGGWDDASGTRAEVNARGGKKLKKITRGSARRGKYDENKHRRGPGGKFADKPGVGDDALKSRSDRAKESKVVIGRKEQQRADELEHDVAKKIGGVSFKDSEPVDVVIGKAGVIEHGIEFKAVLNGKNDKLTMNSYAQVRKIDWEKRNKTIFHTLVADTRGAKPVYYYRRGVAGSARLGSLHKVETMAEAKTLMNMKERDLPAAAKRTDGHLAKGRWKFFEDAEGKGYRDLKTGTVHRAKK